VINKIEQYKKYFSFRGKASRSEYWGTFLIGCSLLALSVILALFVILISSPFTIIFIGFIGWAMSLCIIGGGWIMAVWLWAATSIRRCNDAGINPWFALTLLLPPPFGTIPFIVFGLLKTDTKHGSTD
jgi:uncharacterized membrane protein YhaH (DUF805 family)